MLTINADTNAEDTESEEEVAGKSDGEINNIEKNAPVKDSVAVDNIEIGAGRKMNYCREAEDEPDNDCRSTGEHTPPLSPRAISS